MLRNYNFINLFLILRNIKLNKIQSNYMFSIHFQQVILFQGELNY